MAYISETIIHRIKEKGMTQKEFALRTGIAQSTISDWKRKGMNPSADKILIICDVLDISPYELLGGTESGKYEMPDHIIIQKNTEEYELVEKFRKMKEAQKNRLLGYMEAMQERNS